MKFFKKSRKGFTLVELIVVIAIVAILAAVSVVSYIAFINKGNESADIQLVKQLNISLQGDETLHGVRKTMDKMLDAMEENGFVVENLTKTKSGYDIVWDQKNNRFALLDSANKSIYSEKSLDGVENYYIWKFVDTKNELENNTAAKYSVYLTEEFGTHYDTLLEENKNILVKAGLDTGKLQNIGSVEYRNPTGNYKVTVNANCESFKAVAPTDSFYRYGNAKAVTLESVGAHSYHEYGEAGYINIQNGRLVVEEGSKIGGVFLVDTNGEFNDIKIALVGEAELPSVAVAEVSLDADESKLVLEVQTLTQSDEQPTEQNTEYVWITGKGAGQPNEVTVSTSNDEADFEEKAKSPEETSAAGQVISEEVKVPSEPVDEDSIARIGAVGYMTLASAFNSASTEKVDTVYLLKNYNAATSEAMYSADKRFNLWINKNIVLDGNGHTLRVQNRGVGIQGATSNINVTVQNIKISNVGNANGRVIDTRGRLDTLNIFNSIITTEESTFTGYLQPLTIGGNQAAVTKLNIKDSEISVNANGTKGYAITTFNPVLLNAENSLLKGWACLNIKAADNSAGSRGSVFTVSKTTLQSFNGYDGDTNEYCAVKIEDNNIKVSFDECAFVIDGHSNEQGIFTLENSSIINAELSLMNCTCNLLANAYVVYGGLRNETNSLKVSNCEFNYNTNNGLTCFDDEFTEANYNISHDDDVIVVTGK